MIVNNIDNNQKKYCRTNSDRIINKHQNDRFNKYRFINYKVIIINKENMELSTQYIQKQ